MQIISTLESLRITGMNPSADPFCLPLKNLLGSPL